MERFPLAADGAFAIAGLTGGDWEMMLGFGNRTLPLATIERLGDEERRALELDLGHLLMATVRCSVLVNGEPLVEGSASLSGTTFHAGSLHPASAQGRPLREDGKHGRFEFMTLPGKYDLRVYVADSGRSALLHVDEPILLSPGEVVDGAVFQVRHARVRFRVTAPDSRPRPGVVLLVRATGREFGGSLVATGPGGETTGLVPAGSVEFSVAARRPAGSREPVARIALGTFEFAVGERKEPVEIVLPAAAAY